MTLEIPYDFKIKELCQYLRIGKYSRILLQLPEGVKQYASIISREIENECRVEVIISGDPNWGACDIPVFEAKKIGANLIVHYGHYPYSYNPVHHELGVDVLYIPMEYKGGIPDEILSKLEQLLREKNLSNPIVIATAQHLREAKRIVDELKKKGINARVPEVLGGLPGLVIGCDYRTITQATGSNDSVIVISSGLFHALGAALATAKPVFQIDPYLMKVSSLDEERKNWLKKRYGVIYKALNATRWAIWVGALYGQTRLDYAKHIAGLIEKRGGSYLMVYSRYVTQREILSIDSRDIDAHIITSCPRIPIDDFTLIDFPKPVLTPGEAIMVLTNQLEPYRFPW
jgi:2-(3-amino-3-carboxypropyl)histidine synthase